MNDKENLRDLENSLEEAQTFATRIVKAHPAYLVAQISARAIASLVRECQNLTELLR